MATNQSNINDMKTFLNWRHYVQFLLFCVGALAVARIFGDPVKLMSHGEWLWQTFLSLCVAVPCFYTLCKLTKKWEREGKIPELTNQEKE